MTNSGCPKSPIGAHHWDISTNGVGTCRYCKETKQFPTVIDDALKSSDRHITLGHQRQKQERMKQPDDQPKATRRHYRPRKKHEDTRISIAPFDEAGATMAQVQAAPEGITKRTDEEMATDILTETTNLAEGAPVPAKYSWEQWETETLALLEQIGLEIDELEKEQESIIKRLQRLRSGRAIDPRYSGDRQGIKRSSGTDQRWRIRTGLVGLGQ